VLEFVNSYGVPERLEVTGRRMYEPEIEKNGIYSRCDAMVDGYVERSERQQLREVITAESGYKTRDEYLFLRDLLQSDRIFLLDGDRRREVRVTAENFSHAVRPFEPESASLSIRYVDGETHFTPEPPPDGDPDRIFMATFQVPSSRLTMYLPFRGNVDLMIDRGDGTAETVTADNPQHTYAATGEYTVAAAGHAAALSQIYAMYPPAPQANYQNNLVEIERWGDLGSPVKPCVHGTKRLMIAAWQTFVSDR
jgi:hypothetical protein